MIEMNFAAPSALRAPLSNPFAGARPDAAAPLPLSRGDMLAKVLDEIDYGLLLVNAQGVMTYANQLGMKEVLGGALRLAQGQVLTRGAGDQAAFAAALAGALRGLRRMITLGHDADAVSVAFTPMQPGPDECGEPMALLLIGKRQGNETLSLDFYARSSGLTNAETQVLRQMSQGDKPLDIAKGQGVAISTVRSHIKNIRLKTQTGSIRELLGRVAVLPPIAPVIKVGASMSAMLN